MLSSQVKNNAASESRIMTPVFKLRVMILVTLAVVWQLMAMSGLFYQDVVPGLVKIGGALIGTLGEPQFYSNLKVTAIEVLLGLIWGGVAGFCIGLLLGANRFLSKAYESCIYYIGPTPKIIFLPIMILWFGTGWGSKIAIGAFSSFFPIAISTAAAIRGVDPILVRVGKSFRLSMFQLIGKIYFPAVIESLINSVRLGLGVAIIGVVLAETKLSNAGLGFMIIENYRHFDMPRMYALLIILFVFSIGINQSLTALERRLSRHRSR